MGPQLRRYLHPGGRRCHSEFAVYKDNGCVANDLRFIQQNKRQFCVPVSDWTTVYDRRDPAVNEVPLDESAIGLLLHFLREERGLSLRELSQLADVDHAYIYRLETGDKESPSAEVLSRLIRALRAGKREALMLRFLAEHPATDVALVQLVLKDKTVTYDIFATAAGTAFRGAARPDYAKIIELVRRIMGEQDGNR